jgi:hypothetical protein
MFLRRQACGNCYYLIRNDEESVLRFKIPHWTQLTGTRMEEDGRISFTSTLGYAVDEYVSFLEMWDF